MSSLGFSRNKTYTVRDGDTLSGIAAKFSVRQNAILHANSLASPHKLKIGMRLAIPATPAKSLAHAAPAQGGRTYKVKPGDNDWTIAKRFSTTMHQLHLSNPGVDWSHLKLGSTLRISGSSATATHRLSWTAGMVAPHKLAGIAAAQKAGAPAKKAIASAKKTGGTYSVKNGDNDWVIASHLGITPKQLRVLNPDVKWTSLQIGTKLRVPGSVATVAKTKAIRTRYAKIARDSVIIRRGPTTASDKVTTVAAGLPVKVLDRASGWYKLRFPKGTVGWVRGDMLKPAARPVVAHHKTREAVRQRRHYARRSHRSTEIAMSVPGDASPVIRKAMALRGVPYRYGRSSRSGSDCSGFTSLVYRQQGVRLPRTSRDQSRTGRNVSRGSLRPGDLVFFHTRGSRRVNHVGIYVGGGKFIHSSSGGGKVQVNSLSDGYYQRRFSGARRVLKGSKSKAAKKKAPPVTRMADTDNPDKP